MNQAAMGCISNSLAWIEMVKIAIPSLIVTIGWYISHLLTSERDRKSEIRKRLVDRFNSLIEETIQVRDLAIKYHTNERSVPIELELVSRFADLSLALPQVRKLGCDSQGVTTCASNLTKFKQATTLKHFEDDHTGLLMSDNQLLFEIARSASSTLRCLRECQSSVLLK